MKFSAVDAEDGSNDYPDRYTIKINYGSQLEETTNSLTVVYEFPESWPEATESVYLHFRNFITRNLKRQVISIYYRDEEDDLICLESDIELKEAIRLVNLSRDLCLVVICSETTLGVFGNNGASLESEKSTRDSEIPDMNQEHQSNPAFQSRSHLLNIIDEEGLPRVGTNSKDSHRDILSEPSTSQMPLCEAKDTEEQKCEENMPPGWFINCMEKNASKDLLEHNKKWLDPNKTAALYQSYQKLMENDQQNKSKNTPPAWFVNYMEKFKEDLTLSITTKVVKKLQHSMNLSEDRLQRSTRKYPEGAVKRTRRRMECDSTTDCSKVPMPKEISSDHTLSSPDILDELELPAKGYRKLFQISNYKSNEKYLDSTETMGAKFLCDATIPDGSQLPPGKKFTKSWWILNSGNSNWDLNTKLHCFWSTESFRPEDLIMPVPPLKPGRKGLICIEHTAPNTPGMYESYWRLEHNEERFGDCIWCSIEVVAPLDLSSKGAKSKEDEEYLAKDIKSFNTITIQEPESGEKEVQELQVTLDDVTDKSLNHLDFDSQTATLNNTPLACSPPQELKKFVTSNIILSAENTNMNENVLDADLESVISLSSLESDSEYVVVPIPSCFNIDYPDEPVEIPNGIQGKINSESSRSSVECLSAEMDLEENCDQLAKDSNMSNTDLLNITTEVIGAVNEEPEINMQPEITLNAVSPDSNNNSDYSVNEQEIEQPVEQVRVGFEEMVIHDPEPVLTQPSVSTNATVPSDEPAISEEAAGEEDGSSSSRIVQILPESLLYATATVFNTAKTAFSALQWVPTSSAYTPDEDWNNVQRIQRPSEVTPVVTMHEKTPQANNVEAEELSVRLLEMGFCNRELNEALLERFNNDLFKVVEELLTIGDNNWYNHRH